jgi:hypothetical protein
MVAMHTIAHLNTSSSTCTHFKVWWNAHEQKIRQQQEQKFVSPGSASQCQLMLVATTLHAKHSRFMDTFADSSGRVEPQSLVGPGLIALHCIAIHSVQLPACKLAFSTYKEKADED